MRLPIVPQGLLAIRRVGAVPIYALGNWIAAAGARTAYIKKGSAWANGYCEGLNCKLRYELPNRAIFSSLAEAQVLLESLSRYYNTQRVHSSLHCNLPAREAIIPASPLAP